MSHHIVISTVLNPVCNINLNTAINIVPYHYIFVNIQLQILNTNIFQISLCKLSFCKAGQKAIL